MKKYQNPSRGLFFLISFVVLVLPIVLFWITQKYFDVLKKEVVMELGTENIFLEDFFKEGKVEKNSSFITEISNIDLGKVGEYEIKIKISNQEKQSVLKIVDTIPPDVEFQDLYKYKNYTLDPNDFIVSKKDLSEMTVTSDAVEIQGYGDYEVIIRVTDKSGNITEKKCLLHIGAIKTEYTLELGTKLKKEDLLYNKEDAEVILDSEIERINHSPIGEYEIEANLDGSSYTSKIKIQDTKAPTLELKEVTIYEDQKSLEKEVFIITVNDPSSFTTTLQTKIDFTKIGDQEIKISAEDEHGNKVEKMTKLHIIKDTEPPVFYGITNLTVSKHSTIDYQSGIKAIDAHDGTVSFTVDSSKVNTSVAGTYFATYIATDKKGNKKSVSRKIFVKHDQVDTNRKLSEFASQIGSSIPEINEYVKTKIHYNNSWGEDDPIWYGLTNYAGNCYVHAMIYQAVLRQKGYETQLIWTTDKSHYWNLVKVNGVWRHSDSTPGNKQAGMILSTDEERITMLQGRDWDHTKWPEAK